MKLLFDATGMALSGYHKGGAYVYGLELLKNLQQLDDDLSIELFFNFTRGKHKPKMLETCAITGIKQHSLTQFPPQLLRALHMPTEWFAGQRCSRRDCTNRNGSDVLRRNLAKGSGCRQSRERYGT